MIDQLPLKACPQCAHHAPQSILGKSKRLCMNCDFVFSVKPVFKKKKKMLDKKY